jgi:2-oxoisovalerate dehydrogenase E1 component
MESMEFRRNGLSDAELLELYERILLPRMIEEKMLILLRQGRVSKWFAGIGQEAIACGVIAALEKDEWIFPMHRNLGVFTGRDIPLERLFAQFQGKALGFTQGRDRSFHFGSKEHHIAGMISHLGPQLALAGGVALAHRVRKEAKVSVAFTGDGGTSEGDFHEALNVAAVWELPVLFVIENNGYGLSTPISEQFRCGQLADRGKGYGMEAYTIDGNNILEVYQTVKDLTDSMRENPRPILLECMTFRMRGHEEASGTKYVPQELIDQWSKRDPVVNYRDYLISEGILTDEKKEKIKASYAQAIDEGLKTAYAEPAIQSSVEKEMADVYADFDNLASGSKGDSREIRLVDAVREGLQEAMRKHSDLVIMGQDVAEYGGVFKVTEGFIEEFGKDRVRNTPLCESAIVGAGLGLSISGMKSVVEMQFADFVSSGFNQIVNNLAKIHYRWGQNANVLVRMPTGAGVGAGPFHSQSNEAWFTHTPGLKVVYPAFPEDAKGLLLQAIEDPNPVMFFEHKALYRSLYGDVAEGHYTIPFGKSNIVQEGDELSIITYGMGVHWALELDVEQGQVEVLDLRSLQPMDWEGIKASVQRTGKVIVLQEDTHMGGIGADIAAWISEHCFEILDAPVRRISS